MAAVCSEAYGGLGESLRLGGDARRAEEVLRESLAIQARVRPRSHRQIASTRTMVAQCLVDQRRFAEAERLMLEAYPIVGVAARGQAFAGT